MLERALQSSTQHYYDVASMYQQQSLFDYDEDEPEEDEDLEDEDFSADSPSAAGSKNHP